jgi:hypothetical protein
VTATSNFAKAADVTYSTVLTDDRGNVIDPAKASAVRRLKKTGDSLVDDVVTSPLTAHGFYELRITAAALETAAPGDPEVFSTNSTSVYLRVLNGTILPLDADEYFAQSNANLEMTP